MHTGSRTGNERAMYHSPSIRLGNHSFAVACTTYNMYKTKHTMHVQMSPCPEPEYPELAVA